MKKTNSQDDRTINTHKVIDHGTRSMGRRYELKFNVPPKFYSRIFGAKGSTKRQLEEDTNTDILVPRIGSNNNFINIRGDSEEAVLHAKLQIDQITSARARPPKQRFTHFLSAAFNTDEVKSNFQRFKEETLSDPETSHLHDSVFPAPETLHVTISMLVLPSEEDVVVANECLKECKEIIDTILQGKPLTAVVSGVETFSDCKPSSVNVVFGHVKSEQLQKIADGMSRLFESRGLIRLERPSVQMHLTLINTRLYTNDNPEASQDDRPYQKRSFDATKLLAKYKDFYFGSVTIGDIHISNLHSLKGDDGYYQSSGILKL